MTKNAFSLRDQITVALLAAVLCAVSPFAVNIGPIPLSFATLGVYLCAVLLDGRHATVAVSIYLLLGAVGVPVFAGFTGGFQKFAGPTGGYLLGYLLCAAVAGYGITRCGTHRPGIWVLFLLLGTLLLYIFGTAWFLISTKTSLAAALTACVLPFLPGDAAKIAVAVAAGYPLRQILHKKGYLSL